MEDTERGIDEEVVEFLNVVLSQLSIIVLLKKGSHFVVHEVVNARKTFVNNILKQVSLSQQIGMSGHLKQFSPAKLLQCLPMT
jgi:hypothetical protein